MKLFGFTIARDKDSKEDIPSIVAPQQDDGSVEIAPGGAYGTYVDLEGRVKNEGTLVTKYREMAVQPECDLAIQDVVNEAIIVNAEGVGPVEIVTDRTDLPKSIQKKIKEEFNFLLNLLEFNTNCYEIFKKWYVDGRLYYHIVIDKKNPRTGVQDLRYIDPRKIRKLREPVELKDKATGEDIYKGDKEYYIYNKRGLTNASQGEGVKIAPDSIAFCHSGILDQRNNMVYGHLHKAIKPLNQLRMLEDAVVIYRLARAPERRIFYIDVGNLPKMKAEQYLRDMMVKHKNKLTYDAQTGEVRDDRKFMTMLEDFWLPRREGGRGTEITTLPGGQNLGEMEDIEYFKKKLYKALNVPISRMESEATFNLGRSTEITRDEIKFSKFVKRLRARFSILFVNVLEIHLSLKGVMSRNEFRSIKKDIFFNYEEDNHFTELKEAEIIRERSQLLGDVDSYVGNYYSKTWIKKNVLKMTEDEIERIEKEIKDEEGGGDGGPMYDPGGAPFESKVVKLNNKKKQIKEEKVEELPEPPKELSPEEKKLVDSMSKIMDNIEEDDVGTT